MKKRTIYLAILLGFILALFMIDCEGEEEDAGAFSGDQISTSICKFRSTSVLS